VAGRSGVQPGVTVTGRSGSVLGVRTTFADGFGVETSIRLALASVPFTAAVPVAVPAGLATAMDVRAGGSLAYEDSSGSRLVLQVAAVLPRTPSAPDPGPDGAGGAVSGALAPPPVLLLDAGTLAAVEWDRGRAVRAPRQWWIAGSPDPEEVAVALAPAASADAAAPVVTVRAALRAALLADPLTAGLRHLHAVAALGSTTAAVIGLGLGEVVGTRRRRGELAVLRALGVSRAELRRLLGAEQALVAGVVVLAGAGLGLALSPLLAPALGGDAAGAGVGVGVGAGAGAGVVVPLGAVAAVTGLLLGVTALGALARGWYAERVDVATALRGEVR
jgi:hypothetical protein